MYIQEMIDELEKIKKDHGSDIQVYYKIYGEDLNKLLGEKFMVHAVIYSGCFENIDLKENVLIK